MHSISKKEIVAFLLLFLVGASSAGYFGYRTYTLTHNVQSLARTLGETEKNLASTTEGLTQTLAKLEDARIERDGWELRYVTEKKRVDDLSFQVHNIGSMVGVLDKLAKTDPELLQKYSKVYFLNENYVPAKLAFIDGAYVFHPERELKIHTDAWPYLKRLLDNARAAAVDIEIISAYRSFDEQTSLKNAYAVTYGTGANQFSADQGYSEHQLGTTVDFTTSELGAEFSSFEKTPAYAWLLENAYRYGFILSYPKDNSYYIFEPWHWRFVGKDLAEKLHSEGKHFYDIDQRVLDTYLVSFFD